MAEYQRAEDEELTVGPWAFTAHVEVRPQQRSGPRYDEPALERGDVWFRLVLSVQHNDDSGEKGVCGELSTPYLWSLKEVQEQAMTLGMMQLGWEEWDDTAEKYVTHTGEARFKDLIEKAISRFKLTMPEVA